MRGGGGAARPSFRLPRAEGSGCPASCVTDFETAPACILNCGSVLFQFPIHPPPNEFGFLQCSERLLSTMASAQKCMRTIRSDDPSLYVQPHEGPTWAFTARCVGAGMPLHIERALYFFYRLMAHMELNGVTDFVVPTPTLGLQYDRRCGKRVVGVTRQVESRVRAPAAGVRPAEEEEDASRGFSFQHAARAEHATSGRDTVEMVCPPLVIRLGFTGALYDVVDAHGATETKQDLFCTLFVTPLRNVDLLTYIHLCFLTHSKGASAESKQRESDVIELTYLWRKILQYEAFENLMLGDGLGDPFDYSLDSGGLLGADMLLSVLQFPIKAHAVLRARCEASPDGHRLVSMRVLGFPELDFAQNSNEVRDYVAYMFACIRQQAMDRRALASHVERFNGTKPGERALFENPSLRNPGGWPLRMGPVRLAHEVVDFTAGEASYAREGFTEFGLPRLPIMLVWSIAKSHLQLVSEDSFRLNSGTLPVLTLFLLRKFLASDVSALLAMRARGEDVDAMRAAALAQDEVVITDLTTANPLAISQRYYGDLANPLQNLVTAGCLRAWWTSMSTYVYDRRANSSMTARGAYQCFERYIASCMESHRGMLLSRSYRSLRVEQGLDILETAQASPLWGVDMGEYLKEARKKVPSRIRHDVELSASHLFFGLFEDINRDFALVAGNLEIVLEMLVSSMAWLMGQHNLSFKWFFQGLQIVSGNGHFRMSGPQQSIVIDVRKPNSKGADFSVEQVNRMFLMLGEYLNVDPTQNKQVFVNANRWTPVGLENQGCVETVDNNIVNYPSPELCMRPVVATEVRNADMCSVIKNVFPRNAEQQTVTLSSVDPNKTNQRSLSIKHQVDRANFCCMCTNTLPADTVKNEEFKTMLAVIHTMVPGSAAYHGGMKGASNFNDVRCDKTQSRSRVPEKEPRRSILVKLLPLAHVLASTLVALPNRVGIIPFEISPVPLAFLDWMFLYVRTHLLGVLDTDVVESFSRMKVGADVTGGVTLGMSHPSGGRVRPDGRARGWAGRVREPACGTRPVQGHCPSSRGGG